MGSRMVFPQLLSQWSQRPISTIVPCVYAESQNSTYHSLFSGGGGGVVFPPLGEFLSDEGVLYMFWCKPHSEHKTFEKLSIDTQSLTNSWSETVM